MNEVIFPQTTNPERTLKMVNMLVSFETGECTLGFSEGGPAVLFRTGLLSDINLQTSQGIGDATIAMLEPGVTVQAASASVEAGSSSVFPEAPAADPNAANTSVQTLPIP